MWLHYQQWRAVGLWVHFFLWSAPAEPLRKDDVRLGWSLSVLVLTPSTSACRCWLRSFSKSWWKMWNLWVWHYFCASPLIPQSRSQGVWTRQEQCPGLAELGISGQGTDLTFSTEGALKAMIFVRLQQQTRVLDTNHSAMATSHSWEHHQAPPSLIALSKTHSCYP